ncbi:hypothetical protein CRENBAI_001871 [Crenichthys baileyi]|uniref:Uncharacterized protein n=1 Tax=Crenichthys baileyi TaxID=28760 RepID=A0AAV9R5Q1_9TELE
MTRMEITRLSSEQPPLPPPPQTGCPSSQAAAGRCRALQGGERAVGVPAVEEDERISATVTVALAKTSPSAVLDVP